MRYFIGSFWRERIKKTLALACRIQAPLDAKLCHRFGKSKAINQYTDRAHHAGLVDKDLVGPCRDIIRTRCTDIANHGMYRNLWMQLPQPANFIVNDPCLHWAAARTIDLQNHASHAWCLKCCS